MAEAPVEVAVSTLPKLSTAEKPGSVKAPQSVVVVVASPMSVMTGEEVASVEVAVVVPVLPVEVAVWVTKMVVGRLTLPEASVAVTTSAFVLEAVSKTEPVQKPVAEVVAVEVETPPVTLIEELASAVP